MTRLRSALLSFLVVSTVLSLVAQAVVPESSAASRGHHRVGTEVVHGSDVADGQFPFVAAIGYADPSGAFLFDNQFCGGSLVAVDLVLTAAHCVLGTTPQELAVVVGRTVMTSDQGQVRSVSQIMMDPDFNHAEATNDLALVRLSQPVTGITPIQLIGDGDTTFDAGGTPLTLIGWGDTVQAPHGGKPAIYADRLQQTQVNVVDDDTCIKEWRKTGFNDNSVWAVILCTTPGVFGPGDSGGPLFVSTPSGYVQVMLVSGSYAKHHQNTNNSKNKGNKNNGKDKGNKNEGKVKGSKNETKVKGDISKSKNKGSKNKHKGSNNKQKKQLHQTVPDYGPELSAPSSADFLASGGV